MNKRVYSAWTWPPMKSDQSLRSLTCTSQCGSQPVIGKIITRSGWIVNGTNCPGRKLRRKSATTKQHSINARESRGTTRNSSLWLKLLTHFWMTSRSLKVRCHWQCSSGLRACRSGIGTSCQGFLKSESTRKTRTSTWKEWFGWGWMISSPWLRKYPSRPRKSKESEKNWTGCRKSGNYWNIPSLCSRIPLMSTSSRISKTASISMMNTSAVSLIYTNRLTKRSLKMKSISGKRPLS